jgi:tRNA threonylcarbamoyladenosine biosynthesis protein TsaB
MRILALDTSTDACSTALFVDGVITEEFVVAPQQHSHIILSMMDKLLVAANLKLEAIDAFAFGRGPGSFTGLRIAASVVQALAFAKNRPVIPISTLHAMAKAAHQEFKSQAILVCLDARMNEVYYAAFAVNTKGELMPVMEEKVCRPETVELPAGEYIWHGVGNGWASYAKQLEHLSVQFIQADIYPRARDIVALAAIAYQKGGAVSAEKAVPVYLRNDVAWQNG